MLSDVGVETAYNIHSGFAHGEIFALWLAGLRAQRRQPPDTPVVYERTLQVVAVAARAL